MPDLIEGYLRDLPDLVGRRRVVRDYGTGPEQRTPDRVRCKTREEIEGERLAAENECSVYEALGLSVTAHKDGGTLLLRWSCGKRTLSAVTGPENPVLRRIYAPDER